MILGRLFNLKNIYKNRMINFIFIIMITTIFANYFVGCSSKSAATTNEINQEAKESEKVNNTTTDEVIKEIKNTQNLKFTKIAYASKDKVILYGTIGLIVYDIQNQKICRAIDLESIHMNLIQGDDITIFKINEDASQILMYNEPNTKDRYLYNIKNDSLEKTDIKEFTNEYDRMHQLDEITPYNDEHLKKYKDIEFIDCIAIDKSNICYLIHQRDSKEISFLQILIVNKDTNKEEMYTIFS